MSLVKRRFFSDFEKEEEWLNEMAAKGLALSEYSWARYTFEESGKGEYIYRIEMLKEDPKGPEAAEYLQFMKETGAELVPTGKWLWGTLNYSNLRWVIFRRKASEGAFTIYSDIDSKIKHYKRIHSLWMSLAVMELIIGFFNIALMLVNNPTALNRINFVMGLLLIVLALFFISMGRSIRKKITRLQNDQLIRE
ncbi:DUF2812 domain-containing protein [Paenibacillus sp. DMB5]|uniref:DUF2812 domain-containing protein n=1 Tax=Paenibacillus sp. DMB5 TaxID=1780103 RepID=UPI00076DBBA0|nr:DUF2812 domain-containing protein [Paenibacillus sp. DMB5]KUP26367.1 hypothetical protein AWJ19_32710 [Paenibacillus sp. DMB5]